MKKAACFFLLFCFHSISFSQSTFVYFEKNSSALSPNALAVLDSISGEILLRQYRGDITITGHTDSDATDEYNTELGLNRARSVQKYMKNTGLLNRFHLESKGEIAKITNNRNESEKALNRRVEIQLDNLSNHSVFDQFRQDEQVFKINNFKKTSITTNGGIKLIFGPEIFENIKEYLSIEIRVKEFLTKEDFVLANLTTHTLSDQILESRGVVYIVATQKDDTLKLKQGESFSIQFPDKEIADNMQLFQGVEHGNDLLWNQTTFKKSLTLKDGAWTKTYYSNLTDKQREARKKELIDGDTISRSRSWYESLGKKAIQITETIDANGLKIDTVPASNQIIMNELIQSSTTLGWINCDRFYNSKSPTETLYVEFEGDFIPTVTLVFDEIKSVLRYSYRENNTLVFTDVPVGMNVTIIGLHQEDETSETLFALHKTRTKKGSNEHLNFEVKTADEIKTSLSTL